MTAAVYSHSLTGWYVYEDMRPGMEHVYQDRVAGVGAVLTPRGLTRAVNHATTTVFGAGPFAARTVSLAWHLLNGLLLFQVARTVVTRSAAVMAAGLCLVLPIQTEAVAGVAYRSELIAATALLIALWCVQRGWLAAAFLASVSAVLGKEAGIVALALVPLWAWRHRLPAWTPTVALYWLVAGWMVGLAGVMRLQDGHLWVLQVSDVWRDVGAAVWLMALMVWPAGLTIDHDWTRLTPWMGGAAVFLLAVALEAARRRQWPLWSWALAWTFIALLPRLLMNLGEGLHERHLYTPAIAWSLAAADALFPKESCA